jgi:hypothetical protein
MERIVRLPRHGVEIVIQTGEGAGQLHSNLGRAFAPMDETDRIIVDTMESIVLAHACAGVDVESSAYAEGLETALDAIANHWPEE